MPAFAVHGLVSPDALFTLCTRAVLPPWACLVLAPRWKWSARLAAPMVLPPIFGVIYLYLAIAYFPQSKGSFGSLHGVSRFFQEPNPALAGWLHYLAFDLFIGAWMVRDAQQQKIPHLAVVPCLVLTFLLGPIGLLLYLVLRAVKTRTLAIT